MNEFLIKQEGSLISLEANKKYSFTKLPLEKASKELEKIKYMEYKISKAAVGSGHIAIFIKPSWFCLSIRDLITYIPISIYLSLLLVYLFLMKFPFVEQELVSFYLSILASVTGFSEGSYAISFNFALQIWLFIAGFISLFLSVPIYLVFTRFVSKVSCLIFAFLYYRVLGLFINLKE